MGDTRLFADAKEVTGYLNAGDGGSGRPTVVVIHEWWGLNEQIRSVVDRLGKEGFVAFAPDLFRGKVAKSEDEAAALMKGLDWSGAELELGAAAQALKTRDPASKIGVLGFCLGGGLALMAAANIPAYAAAVPYYGIPSPERADLTKIRGRVQGHYALQDDWCSPDRVAQLEKTLAAGGVRFELHHYDAPHAFANDRRPEVYSERDAKLAWERTVKFLHEALA